MNIGEAVRLGNGIAETRKFFFRVSAPLFETGQRPEGFDAFSLLFFSIDSRQFKTGRFIHLTFGEG